MTSMAGEVMSDSQQECLDIIKQGHNLYIGGQAGCGKSYLVERIADWAASVGKTCAVTCTTGIACSNYPSRLKPMTIHKWSGLNDGRFTSQRLFHLISKDERYEAAKNRILNVDILIIDEISMMSLTMFEKMETVLRIKNENKVFGGIQVIGVGDFLQLPPVKNTRYRDLGEYAFESKFFFKHHVFLKDIFRQKNKDLIKCVNNLSKGILDEETNTFVRKLARPLQSNEEPLKLFSNNLLTDIYNRDAILEVPGDLYTFESKDSGEEKHLDELIAPRTLWLKKGAKVILLRNISDTLVNGLRGVVTDIQQDTICVYFPSVDSVSHLQRMSFTVFDPDTNVNLAVRKQFPLKLCYAITVHKAQGMTVDRVEVDCRGMFQPGQLAVAIGRVRSEDGLRVVNFSKNAVIPQPAILMEFLESESLQLVDDCSCCHYSINFDEVPENRNDDTGMGVDLAATGLPENGHDGNNDYGMNVDLMGTDVIDYEQLTDNDQEIDDDILLASVAQLLELPYENNNCSLPADLNILSDIRKLQFMNPSNQFQEDQNTLNKFLQDNDVLLHAFASQQYAMLTSLYGKSIKVKEGETIPQNQLSDFMASFNTHITSDLYISSCKALFQIQCNQEAVFAVCFKIMTFLRKTLLKEKSEVLPISAEQHVQNRATYDQLSSTARGKIRYIGGYTVACLRSKYQHLLKSNLYKTGHQGITTYLNSKKILEMISCFEINEQTLNETSSDPESLLETSRKQNIARGLTNITDETYQWFGFLIYQTLHELNTENLTLHGSILYERTLSSLKGDAELFAKFVSLVPHCKAVDLLSYDSVFDVQKEVSSLMENIIDSVCAMETVFCEMIKKVLSVLTKQFSKDVTAAFEIKKKFEHRKQIKVGTKRKLTAQSSVRHTVTTKPSKTVQTRLTPRQKQSTSAAMSDLDTSDSESESSVRHTVTTKPSKTVQTRQTARQKPSTSAAMYDFDTSDSESEDHTLCEKCGKEYKGSEQWIACDSCEKWFHRKCAGLSSAAKWKMYQSTDKNFFCPYCQ